MRSFFPTEKDIAEDKKALKMLTVTKRGQKKTAPQKTRTVTTASTESIQITRNTENLWQKENA